MDSCASRWIGAPTRRSAPHLRPAPALAACACVLRNCFPTRLSRSAIKLGHIRVAALLLRATGTGSGALRDRTADQLVGYEILAEGLLPHFDARKLSVSYRPVSAVRSSDDDVRIRRCTGHRLERLRTSD